MRILAAGGGSGGHVSPVVAVLDELKKQLGETPLEARFVCDKAFEAQSRKLMATASISVDVSVITAGKLRRYKNFKKIDYFKNPKVIGANIIDIAKVAAGFFQSLGKLIAWRPDVVFAKGGYVCLPLGLAAWVLRIPVVIHDSDARPGLTSRILARFARAIATGYPLENYPYPAQKSTYTGVPIDGSYQPISREQQAKLKQQLGLTVAEPLVVAIGGSLGSQTINRAMIEAGPELMKRGVNVFLMTGQANFEAVENMAKDLGNRFHIKGFMAQGMSELLGAADVVVTRASATVLQELAGLAKPTIAVPARTLGDQHKNAAVYEKAQAAIVLQDDQLDSGDLTPMLLGLMGDQVRQGKLADRLHEFAKPRAATDVAALLRRIGLPGSRR